MPVIEKFEDLNLQIPSDLFKKLLLHAMNLSMSINDLLIGALEKELIVIEHRLRIESGANPQPCPVCEQEKDLITTTEK